MTNIQRGKYVLIKVLTPFFIIILFYAFIASLDLMTNGFRLIMGVNVSGFFGPWINKGWAGLIIGILVTVLVQSSSTSTNIVIAMVASDAINVRQAIPIIMGANIGTSVTSTLVAFAQVADQEKFRRSFAAATVHDMFNILSVLVLLPIEIIAHPLELLTGAITQGINTGNTTTNFEWLDSIKWPAEAFVKLIVQVDKKVVDEYTVYANDPEKYLSQHNNKTPPTELLVNCSKPSKPKSLPYPSKYLFCKLGVDGNVVGWILAVVSIILLVACLGIIVKILSSIFKGSGGKKLQQMIKKDLPGRFGPYFTGYLFILVGTLITFLFQSSSAFTSSLIPMVGAGLVELERVFPLTLGSNIGTTITTILGAFSADPAKFHDTLQIALCHTFFNIIGICIWYPIPFIRSLPLYLARKLGELAAEYRWIALVYLVGVFFIIPGIIVGLSFADDKEITLWCTLGVVALFLGVIIGINVLQSKKPEILPTKLRNWNFLPPALHSLEPYDKIFRKTCFRCKRFNQTVVPDNNPNQVKQEKNQIELAESFSI